MASIAVYSSPGRAESWPRHPNTHLQADQYYKPRYRQNSLHTGMQQNFPAEQLRAQFGNQELSRSTSQQPLSQLQNLNITVSHSPVRNSSPIKSTVNDFDKPEPRLACPRDIISKDPIVYNSLTVTSPVKLSNAFVKESSQCTSQPSQYPSTSQKPVSSVSKTSGKLDKNNFTPIPIIRSLKCYSCHKFAKEKIFIDHLFFGAIKCIRCEVVLPDCEKFKAFMVRSIMGASTCNHTLEYCFDPFSYLNARLSSEQTPSMGGVLHPTDMLMDLSVYVGRLSCLEDKNPWCYAIAKCRKHLPSKFMKLSRAVTPPSAFQDRNTNLNTREILKNSLLEDMSLKGIKRPAVTDSLVPLQSISPKHSSSFVHTESSVREILLSQSYDLEHLEEAVEYVKVAEDSEGNSAMIPDVPMQSSIKPKPRAYKKRKERKGATDTNDNASGSDATTELFELPDDGNYLILRNSIEECPMCYKTLCPSRFTVNVETFLMTTCCTGCNLPIYIVPNNSSSGVFIINSEEDSTNKPKPVKRKRGRPKKPKKVLNSKP